MLSVFDRGQKRPQTRYVPISDEPMRLDEARLAAWAAALGQERLPQRRPHRGQLPDVDWTRATEAPARPGLFARLWRRLRWRLSSPDGVASGVSPAGLAQVPAGPYLAPVASMSVVSTPADDDRRAA